MQKNIYLFFSIGIFVFLFFTFSLKVQAANYYVSTGGSDSNPGSESSPWRTIEKAVSNSSLNPGDIIYVKKGTYNIDPLAPGSSNNCEMMPTRSGTNGNPITIKTYNNEDVILDGRWDIKTGGGVWSQNGHAGWWSLDWKWIDAGFLDTKRGGQLWDGNKFIPSVKTGNFSPPNSGSWWMLDPAAHKIYYRPANGSNPDSLPISFAACRYMLEFPSGISNWVVDGIDAISGIVQTYQVHNGATNITFQNIKMSYAGDNACKPGRDGTNGHSLTISGGPGIVVRNSEFSQDVSELIHTDESPNAGATIDNNYFHDASMDPGWGSQCADQYGSEYDERRPAPGIIIRSDNVVLTNNQFYRNNYEAIRIESDTTGGGPSRPSNIIVSGNTVVDNIGAGIACSSEIASNNVDIFNNYLSGNNRAFTWQGQINLQGSCTNYKIHDNTIVNTRTTPIQLNGNAASVYNNCTSGCSATSPPVPTPTPTPTLTPPPSGGSTLRGDLNNDKIVNSLDWSIMNSRWFTSDASADLNSDGIVNSLDFSIMNGNWLKSG